MCRRLLEANNKRATNITNHNKLIGVALAAVGNGVDETTGRVLLNGSFA